MLFGADVMILCNPTHPLPSLKTFYLPNLEPVL